mmetsp:Transcript_22937/g.38815  ORF Transcript_22937/g.38815 Transcript_22937/m.38815 type:complete len:260 (+) Transcript_22937:59-838(+)
MSSNKRAWDDVDEDLICSVCVNLVEDAVQSPCCGSLFCRECVKTWLKDNKTCPSCRGYLCIKHLQTDKKSDMKSAACLRNCVEDGCDFCGTRAEMLIHDCANNDEKFAERVEELEDGVCELKKEHEAFKNSVLKKACKGEAKTFLMDLCNLAVLQYFQYKDSNSFLFSFSAGNEIFFAKLTESNYNVSLFVEKLHKGAQSPRDHTFNFHLVNPGDVSKSKKFTISYTKSMSGAWGATHWMTSDEFKKCVVDGNFVFGIE